MGYEHFFKVWRIRIILIRIWIRKEFFQIMDPGSSELGVRP